MGTDTHGIRQRIGRSWRMALLWKGAWTTPPSATSAQPEEWMRTVAACFAASTCLLSWRLRRIDRRMSWQVLAGACWVFVGALALVAQAISDRRTRGALMTLRQRFSAS